ncbi:hypothetical protein M2451_000887 [Dysgonomonas sp. PFB1-18]|uniref:hypothetical protein n=1 Tax=unclassified Dysgonomonas TaxID=2630389 RepID=UPI0024736221|nr:MULTISPECIES: hypothetical protein [unclassified Dysgonomonas]MDH6308576.1 hypothetical protein [Dysgonomonas sp. PF1-14]MDH6338077.1 hypothetical protein [Dysgonomonas sp. PF1-16]MDH6379574.1 hypothetical protein [Dysgonomonas sp. PFB1-18]MDH6396904.1 hypothetical protein [Dysgonomonas sp. PF1-23]
MKTKIIILLLLVVSCPFSMAQRRDFFYNENAIYLGHYIIDTTKKTVGWINKEHINGTHMGYKVGLTIDTLIKPQTTCLYITNNQLVFKEHYVPETTQTPGAYYEIEGYSYNKGLYKRNGKYYHLKGISPTTLAEIKIPKGINFDRLTYVEGNPYYGYGYLYDETGLYYLDVFNTKEISKLAFAKNCRPVMRKFYCEYNGEAFQGGKKIGRIDQFTEIDMRRDGETTFFTDGRTVFSSDYAHHRKLPGMDKWIQLTDGNYMVKENNCVYFPFFKEHNRNNLIYYNVLFATPDSLVLVDCYLQKEIRKIDSVFIKQGDNYERLDIAEYKLSANNFYTYRNKNYYGIHQIKNDFDMPNLKWLKGLYGRTDGWLSDGKVLTHYDLFNLNKEDFTDIGFTYVPLADDRNLKAITENILFDGINFYELSNGSIEVIPVKNFWFAVEVISAVSAY